MVVSTDRMVAGLPSWVQNNKEGGATKGDTPWLQGFAQSAVESIPELFGHSASADTMNWRRENPIAGVTSELLGTTVPYVGWYGASKKIPALEKTIQGIGNLERAPFLTSAAREIARFAPLEAARVGVAGATGDMPVGDVASSAAFNLVAGGVVGGAFGMFTSGGPRTKSLLDIVPAVKNLDDPYQLQMREMRGALAAGQITDPEYVKRVQAVLGEYSSRIRTERPVAGQNYLEDLATEKFSGATGIYPEARKKDDIRRLNRLFKPGNDGIVRKMFATTASESGFKNLDERRAAQDLFGLPENFEEFVQYPRYITSAGKTKGGVDKGAKLVHESITRSLDSVGHNTWIGREGREGLAVVAKKVGEPGKASTKDKWVIFKTDTPGLFVPEGEAWAKKVIGRSAWMNEKKVVAPAGLEIPNVLENILKDTPMQNYLAEAAPKGRLTRGTDFIESMLEKKGYGNVVGEAKGAVTNARNFLREYLAPSSFQFMPNPRANYLWGMSRATFDHANFRAESILHGDLALKGKNVWAQIWKTPEYSNGLLSNIDEILDKPKNLEDLSRIWQEGRTLDEAAGMGVSDELYSWLKQLDSVDKKEVAQIQGIQKWAGSDDLFQPMANHYMLSRTWKGNHRVVINDEAGQAVWMASGHTRRQAIEEANDIVAQAQGRGMTLKAQPATLAGRTDDLALAQRVKVGSAEHKTISSMRREAMSETYDPKTFKKRTDMGGYTGQSSNLTKDDVREILTANVTQRQKYLAELTVKARLADEFGKLAVEDSSMYRQLLQRLDDLSGKPGPLAQIQNQLTDKILGGVLGPNSATKIVRTANTLMMNFQLGMGNAAFPILNALTFMQTTLPHVAFLMTAAPQRVARYYSEFPMAGSDRLIKGSASVLDMFKLMRGSFREMGNPDAQLLSHFTQAAKEGVTDPRLVEEYVGASKKAVTDLRSALSGPEGFVGWLKAVSEFMPGQSEKLARGHTFVTGHIIGRDMMGLEGDKLYRFAKQFTNNTMYLYSTADRARIMTTPLGSAFGLFKNWQAHFIASMMEYTGEAFFRGNWKPFTWMMGGASVVGGVAATPLYLIADQASRMLSDKPLMNHIYDNFGRVDKGDSAFSDAIMYGLPAFLGLSLQGSSTLPGSDPANDAGMMFSFVHMNRAMALGRAVGTTIDNWGAQGVHPVADATARDQFIQALAPKTIARVAQMVGEEGMRSLNTGNPVLDKMSLGEKMMYASGMNPVSVDRTYAVHSEMYAKQEAMKEKVTTYGRLVANAWDNKDYRRATELIKNGMAEGVDISSITKSAKARQEKRSEDIIDRSFKPEEIRKFSSMIEK